MRIDKFNNKFGLIISRDFFNIRIGPLFMILKWPIPNWLDVDAIEEDKREKQKKKDLGLVNRICEAMAKHYPKTNALKLPAFLRDVMAGSSIEDKIIGGPNEPQN